VSVHGPSPDGGGLNIPLSPAQFARSTQPGTAIGRAWDGRLDELAAGLRQLSAAGVPVLFRPLLEMNGGAFWWDGQSGADLLTDPGVIDQGGIAGQGLTVTPSPAAPSG
jgi:mannan endo-1,4-beta-mannosidase